MVKQSQDNVRPSVELIVNGVSCSISERILAEMIGAVVDNSRYSYKRGRRGLVSTLDADVLSEAIINEIGMLDSFEMKMKLAAYKHLPKQVVEQLMYDDQVDVLRELTQNEHAIKQMSQSQICKLLERTSDICIRKNILHIIVTDYEMVGKFTVNSRFVSLVLQHADYELREQIAEYFAEKQIDAEEDIEHFDEGMKELINNLTENKRSNRKDVD